MQNKNIDKIFYSSIISFFIGIFIQSTLENFNIILIIFFTLLFIMIWLFLKFNLKSFFKLNLIIFILIFFIFGFLRSELHQKNISSQNNYLVNTKITQNFIVDDEPEQKGWHSKLILKFENSSDKIISWVPNLPKYNYGDKLELSGWLLKIKNFKNTEGNDFDYINFLKKNNIFYELKNPKIKFISSGNGNYIKANLFKLKTNIVNQIKKLLPEPESSLLAGILIGAKEDMGKNLLEDFRKTGIIHIIVLSGFNLTILAEFIMILLAVFGRKTSAVVGSISIILFAIMTGASATIVRASLMALLVIVAKLLGRNSEALRLLFVAGFIMLLFNPMLLLYDASFQLSFLATLGLLLFSSKIEDWIKFGDFKIVNFKEILAATLSTQIFVFPLLLYMMGEISIVAPIVNILILILVPFSMIFGIVTLIISYFWFNLALLLAFFNYLILAYDLSVVNLFADFKFATFEYKNFSAIMMLIVYLLYLSIWIFWRRYKK